MEPKAKLRIESLAPEDVRPRVLLRDLQLSLNDMPIPYLRNFYLSGGVDEGCVKLTLEMYVDRVEADADVLALIKDLSQSND